MCLAVSGPSVDGPTQPLVLLPPPSGQQDGIGADRPTSLAVGGAEHAPPPPPRTKTGHSRSSSLDTQLVDLDEKHRAGKIGSYFDF